MLWAARCIRFERDLASITLDDHGELFKAFRKIIVEKEKAHATYPTAILRVRFRFRNLSQKTNCRLSLIPIPFIVAQPGFRSKTWLLGEHSGDFMGFYEFDTKMDAETYLSSLPLRIMRRRAQAGSLSHEVYESTPDDIPGFGTLHAARWGSRR